MTEWPPSRDDDVSGGGVAVVVTEVCCGCLFTVAVMESGQVCTFGDHAGGKLGHGEDWWMTDWWSVQNWWAPRAVEGLVA